MGVNLKGISKAIANLKSKLGKLGVDTKSIIPKGYSKLNTKSQEDLYNQLTKARDNYINTTGNTLTGTKRVNASPNISKGYKNFLNRSGLIDNPINKQKYDDIKEYTKLSRQIQKGLSNIDLNNEINFEYCQELSNMTKYTNVDEYVNNVPQQALKFNLESKITELKEKIDSSTLENFIKSKTTQLNEKQVKQLINKYNKLSVKNKIKFNVNLIEKYFQEYEDRKKLGIVDEYGLLKSLLESED